MSAQPGISPRSAETPIAERYTRAARWAPPRAAATIPGVAVEGYWLDNTSFFFVDEERDVASGTIIGTPSIIDARSGQIRQLMAADALARLLNVEPAALLSAEFDMPDSDTLAVSVGVTDYLIDWRNARRLRATAAPHSPALYSPDGRYACFVDGPNLRLMERHSGAQRALTDDGEPLLRYGQQPETCLAAVSYRRRPYPVGLWSANSQWLLTHQIDERGLPGMQLLQHVAGGRPVLHEFKYVTCDDPLAVTIPVAIHVPSGRVLRFDQAAAPTLAYSPFFYRMAWFGSDDTAWLVRMDRYRTHAELMRLSLTSGDARTVLSETAASGYLDLQPIAGATPNIRTLARSDEIIWFSERDGWGHLYLHDATTGQLKNRITGGEWLVRDIVHVDEESRTVMFLACGVAPDLDPASRCLCRVGLDGQGFEVLLQHAGDIHVPAGDAHRWDQDRPFRPVRASAGVSEDGRFAVVRYASVDRGNQTQIVALARGTRVSVDAVAPGLDDMPPRRFDVLAADGATRLRGVLFLPSNFSVARRYPLVDYIYPGPQIAWQPQSFGTLNACFAQALAELGMAVMMLDTRGMPTRSRAFHQGAYGSLLEPQLSDHAAAVKQLCAHHGFLDAGRVGMIGWSGGGAATVRAMCDYPEIFKVGVSACGNHDCDRYSANWSDKYRGPPRAEGWAECSNLAVAERLSGELLLISGDMDENVHVGQTLALVDALVRANRDFELLIVPNEGHSVLMAHGYAMRRAWDFLVRHLLGEQPPAGFELRFTAHELTRFAKYSRRELRQ